MKLILSIVSHEGQLASLASNTSFSQSGGVIGRAQSCDLVLPDLNRTISSKHALVSSDSNGFRITDTSLNGVYLNSNTQAITPNKSVQLCHGDLLYIGDYVISVKVESSVEAVPGNPFSSNVPEEIPASVSQSIPQPSVNPFIPESSPYPAESGGAPLISDPELFTSLDPLAYFSDDAPKPKHELPAHAGPITSSEMSIDDIFRDAGNESVGYGEDPFSSIAAQPDNIPAINEFFTPPQSTSEVLVDNRFDIPVETGAPSPLEGSLAIPDDWSFSDQLHAPVLTPLTPPMSVTPMPTSALEQVHSDSQQEGSAASEPDFINHQLQGDAALPLMEEAQQLTPTATVDVSGMAPGNAFEAFLAGAQMNDPKIPEGMEEQFFRTMGELFRLSTEGLIDILRARADIKSAFRMNMTTIQPVENNPLKFSLCTDDALNTLINNPGGACLSADQAFREAFNDIKAHELAVMAGMQGALGDVLKRFEPLALESYFESHGGKSLLQQKKSWYWDQYIQQHTQLLNDAEDQFQDLFGAAFTAAYEKQVAKLKKTAIQE
jgi:type VI secretion system protein